MDVIDLGKNFFRKSCVTFEGIKVLLQLVQIGSANDHLSACIAVAPSND